jgi:hypothetical protein
MFRDATTWVRQRPCGRDSERMEPDTIRALFLALQDEQVE